MLQENQLNNANEWRRKAYLPYPTLPTLPFLLFTRSFASYYEGHKHHSSQSYPSLLPLSIIYPPPPQFCTGWTETWDSPYPLCIHSSWILGQHHLILLSHSIWGSSNHQLEIVWFCIIWWNCLKQKSSR